MQTRDGLIRLDFERGTAELTPGEVTALLSDEALRIELRRAVRNARKNLPVEVEQETK